MERSKAGDTPSSSGDTSSTSSSTSSSSTSTSTSASSTSSSGAPKNAFDGAPAFDATKKANGTSTQAQHGTGTENPAGKNCLACHVTGGAGTPWTFAGTVYDAAGTALKGVEVRGIDAAGKAESVYTDDNGNFWSEGTVKPTKVGVRNGQKMMLMSTALNPDTDGGCQRNTCHNSTGGQAKITL